MTWLEESRALRSTGPSADGLRRLAAALGESVTVVAALHGGVATSTHAIDTPTRSLVIKRFRADDDTAPLEWERLHLARSSSVPTPDPVAIDEAGAWFGTTALVMARLPGTVVYPPDVDLLGQTLAAIHATAVPEPLPAVLGRPPLWAIWEEHVPFPPGVVDAIRELQAVAPREPTVFSHTDFHPGNVLVDGGALTGVVDWSGARMVARGFDVALMRCDLSVEPGGDAPDRFLAAYEAVSGTRVEHMPLWDLLAAARALEYGAGWVDAWNDVGLQLTPELILERAGAFAASALSRLA